MACTGQSPCSASFKFERPSGTYEVAVQYFDLNHGASHFDLFVNDRRIDSWAADDHLPSDQMNGHTSTRRTVSGVNLRAGDVVRIVGHPDGGESAPIDYVEIVPERGGTDHQAHPDSKAEPPRRLTNSGPRVHTEIR